MRAAPAAALAQPLRLIAQPRFTRDPFTLGFASGYWTDGWDGYPWVRERLLSHVVQRKVSNPLVAGGDIHCGVVADLKLNFDDAKSAVESGRAGAQSAWPSSSRPNFGAWVPVSPAYANIMAQAMAFPCRCAQELASPRRRSMFAALQQMEFPP